MEVRRLFMSDSDNSMEIIPAFPFLPAEEAVKLDRISEHKAKMDMTKRERPDPRRHMKVAVYIRYFNTTEHENYLDVIKSRYEALFAQCVNWEFVGFYVDNGATAPVMDKADAWGTLLCDCIEKSIDLIITKKISNVSKDIGEMTFCARILAALEHPVALYFESDDVFTAASYYQHDLKDDYLLPLGWEKERMLDSSFTGELHD